MAGETLGTFDFVVVGGGAAGCVVARRLAEGGATVALVEAGPSDEGVPGLDDLARYDDHLGGPLDWNYGVERPAPRIGRIRHPRGRVLGGSSSINTCIWIPLPAVDLARWRDAGAEGWTDAALAPAIARLAAAVPTVSSETEDPASAALVAACREAGYPVADLVRGDADGVGWLRIARDGPRRLSAAALYIHRAPLPADRLAIFTDAQATRLDIPDGDGPAAVETTRGRLAARREIVLAGGAFETPKLLMLSGIGPAGHLAEHGIAVRRDLPAVGAHLADHAVTAVNWSAIRRPATIAPFNWASVLFARSRPGLAAPDLELHLGSTSFNRYDAVGGTDGFTVMVSLARPASTGRVRLASADPLAHALVDPGYFSDPVDLRTAIDGIGLARRLVRQPALTPWVGAERRPGPDLDDDAALTEYILSSHGTDYHPGGSCRMGRADDPRAVVDPHLQVRGVPRLRVCDASIFPRMVGVNIVATTMLVAERAAELILTP